MTSGPDNSVGAFLRTTDIFPENPQELLVHLTHSYTESAQAINVRDISLYDEVELLNGQQFFTVGDPQTKRLAYRKCFPLGATGVGATTTIVTGISGFKEFTRIYGTAITANGYIPLPYVSVTAANQGVELFVDLAGSIKVINGAASAAITSGIIVLEYLKN